MSLSLCWSCSLGSVAASHHSLKLKLLKVIHQHTVRDWIRDCIQRCKVCTPEFLLLQFSYDLCIRDYHHGFTQYSPEFLLIITTDEFSTHIITDDDAPDKDTPLWQTPRAAPIVYLAALHTKSCADSFHLQESKSVRQRPKVALHSCFRDTLSQPFMSTKSAVAELWRNDGVHSTKLRISPQDIYTNFAFQTTADADVPNGASVLVLGASGCFSQVQLPSGRQGWVKTTHLRASSTTIKAESPSTPRVSGSSSARTPPTQPRLPSHSSHHASDFDGFASSRQLHRAVGCNQRASGSSAKSAAVPDVDMCLDAMKERLEVLCCVQLQRVDSPISRSDFSTRSPADKLKYLERISGSSPSASAHGSQPAAAVSSADQAWEGLEEFCDVLFDVVSKRSTSDSQGWRSKSVAQKIRYLAELKTPIIGNTPLPSKSGFVRAHKYPVFLAAEAMATMTDEQRMIMLNFQNASSNYMLKRSQEKHNQWEQELRDCVEKGKAMSPAAIQHVACQVHSLIEHYQAELATPDADKAQLDGWLKEALKPLTLINLLYEGVLQPSTSLAEIC